jgi:hypothetical protein
MCGDAKIADTAHSWLGSGARECSPGIDHSNFHAGAVGRLLHQSHGGRGALSTNVRNLLFTIPVWGFDGTFVDLLYRSEAAWFGDVVTLPVVATKICVDQFGYNPFFAAPFGVLTYEWKNNGVSVRPLRQLFTLDHYRGKIIPTLLATWAVWIPLMAIIYSLPLALQFPLFGLALSFWVLLLTYMTNRFAGKIEADAPLALAVADVEELPP